MIYNIPNIIPANSYFTTEMLVTALRSMMNDYGGENLDTFDLRLWLNIGLTKAASFIRTYAPQYYTTRWQANLVAEDYWGADLNYGIVTTPYVIIDLAAPVTVNTPIVERGEKSWPPTPLYSTIVPYKYVCNISSLQIVHRYNTATQNLWNGLPQKLDIDKFTAVVNGLNDQWRQEIVWTVQGHKVLVWAGPEVLRSPSLGNPDIATKWYQDSFVELTVLRKPILDDLGDLDELPRTTNYFELADCPDEAIGLVLQYAREAALGVLGKPEDPNAKQSTMISEQSLLTSLGHVQQPTQ